MQAIAAISIAVAGAMFCAMHIIKRVLDYRTGQDREKKIETTRKELSNEILHGGNVARICALKLRLQKLLED